ncbi:hypothetical protein EVAR_7441_1 [Eumeta japonica]|uniref:Uncharacterized protein n=1 Tax=Eumeta variegata TaxID=151549 RepID=A0A4C1V6B8_EUMVA|nr:hypothetical protein EVAR_7441_1 [Eumeta japonica]
MPSLEGVVTGTDSSSRTPSARVVCPCSKPDRVCSASCSKVIRGLQTYTQTHARAHTHTHRERERERDAQPHRHSETLVGTIKIDS